MKEPRRFTVGAEFSGERLDKFLVQCCPELGRRGARWLTEHAAVTVDGARAAKSRRLRAGEVVELTRDYDRAPAAEPELPLRTLLERDDLVVVDKPAGQPSAPLGDLELGSLAGALLARYPEMEGIGYRPREPGLLHRLDTRTSGLVIAARTPLAFDTLRAALETHALVKRYLAIVSIERPLPDAGRIELALGPDRAGSGRVVVADVGVDGARLRNSQFRVLARRGRWALVEVEAPRAYRHQVRVHLASSGWPIAGDSEYGGSPTELLRDRHALHASHVAWAGDERVAAFDVDSALPEDLRAFFDAVVGEPAVASPITARDS